MNRHYRTLELDKILEMLANEASLSETAERAKEILPETDIASVSALLCNTGDAYGFMSRYSAPSFGAAVNVSSPLRRAEASGVRGAFCDFGFGKLNDSPFDLRLSAFSEIPDALDAFGLRNS